jgi:tRNA-uridine aminocarboxypropyltransferase
MKPSPPEPRPEAPSSAARGFRRDRCQGCALPVAACLCQAATPLASRIEVHVVMPASESRSMSNTARLLQRWLVGTRLIVRGALPSERSPAPSQWSEALDRQHALLLFPEERAPAASADAEPRPLRVPSTTGLAQERPRFEVRQLIVPDGTWAQARHIVRRELLPLGLPRLALDRAWPSIYELRRKPSGICTFEAVAVALGLLDSAELAAGLLQRFSRWSQQQMLVKRGGASARPLSAPPPHPALTRLRDITG